MTDNAPGCFGSAIVFSHDSVTCGACPHFEQCAGVTLERLNQISGTVNVTDLMAKHRRAQKLQAPIRAARQQEQIENAPPPVQATTQKPAVTAPVERKTTVARVVFEIDEATQQVIARIPNQKAAAQAVVLCKANRIEIAKEALSKGENPFTESGPKYLQVACDMLLRGGFTRGSLKEELQAQLGWTPTTAASHVSIAAALLPAFDIASLAGETFVLSPLTA